jgi:hypothetical protein
MENTTQPQEITTGMVVSYTEPGAERSGWYRVRKVTKNTVNLGSVFGRTLCHKGVPKDQVKEDEAAWYANWQQSETYRCM